MGVHNSESVVQASSPILASTASSADTSPTTLSLAESTKNPQTELSCNSNSSDETTETDLQAKHLRRPETEQQPIFNSQYKGTKLEYRDPETLDQPESDSNLPSLIDVFSATRDKARTSLKAIDLAFEEEVSYWREQFSVKFTELEAATPEVKDTLLDLGRCTASAEDLETLITDVRNLPGSGDTTFAKAQDATLTDWVEHRQ